MLLWARMVLSSVADLGAQQRAMSDDGVKDERQTVAPDEVDLVVLTRLDHAKTEEAGCQTDDRARTERSSARGEVEEGLAGAGRLRLLKNHWSGEKRVILIDEDDGESRAIRVDRSPSEGLRETVSSAGGEVEGRTRESMLT